MRFLLKMAFWLGIVLVLLPGGGSHSTDSKTPPVTASDAMAAAKAAVTDMRAFCERQAEACTVGSQAAVAIGHRAQAGVKMLYDFLNEQLGPDTGATGSARRRPSQNTLTPADLEPAWRGPGSDERDRPA
jgi:uncharacterized protein DUF5330